MCCLCTFFFFFWLRLKSHCDVTRCQNHPSERCHRSGETRANSRAAAVFLMEKLKESKEDSRVSVCACACGCVSMCVCVLTEVMGREPADLKRAAHVVRHPLCALWLSELIWQRKKEKENANSLNAVQRVDVWPVYLVRTRFASRSGEMFWLNWRNYF